MRLLPNNLQPNSGSIHSSAVLTSPLQWQLRVYPGYLYSSGIRWHSHRFILSAGSTLSLLFLFGTHPTIGTHYSMSSLNLIWIHDLIFAVFISTLQSRLLAWEEDLKGSTNLLMPATITDDCRGHCCCMHPFWHVLEPQFDEVIDGPHYFVFVEDGKCNGHLRNISSGSIKQWVFTDSPVDASDLATVSVLVWSKWDGHIKAILDFFLHEILCDQVSFHLLVRLQWNLYKYHPVYYRAGGWPRNTFCGFLSLALRSFHQYWHGWQW